MLDDPRSCGTKCHSLTEAIDTTRPSDVQTIGVLAELERSLIVERTQGMKEARAPKALSCTAHNNFQLQ